MPPPECAPKTLDELLDKVLLEMVANHPDMSPAQESRMKAALLEIMADADGWKRDPDAMVFKFSQALFSAVGKPERSTEWQREILAWATSLLDQHTPLTLLRLFEKAALLRNEESDKAQTTASDIFAGGGRRPAEHPSSPARRGTRVG